MDSRHDEQVSHVSDRLEKSLSIHAEDNHAEDKMMEKYTSLISDGKRVAKQGDIQKALELFRLAYGIHQTPKLASRIKKIEEIVAQNDTEDEDGDFVDVNNCGLMLYRELFDRLYNYQRDGVAFLYCLYKENRKGGVLADDMGLGKTIQIISFLSGMYDSELIRHTLLVMPTSLITNWVKEFTKWTPGMRVKEFHGSSKAERTRSLERVQRRGGVIITTYTMLMNNWQQLASYQGKEFCWDYMVLDEAHKIKNSTTKTAKSAYAIPSRNRILLTGTPVQNNLREMWTLFDFACKGSLLGTAKTFKTEYENPITRAREKDATPGEKVLGSRMSENLIALIKPYYLRRTKAEVQKTGGTGEEEANKDETTAGQTHSGAVMPQLTRKNDLIVWTYLSPIQEDIYRQFISMEHIKELLTTTRSPLAELTILKKLCDHPRLLSANAIAKLGLEDPAEGFPDEEAATDPHSVGDVSDETLVTESGKLTFLLQLLERLRQEGHRTLVFAHYRKVLDFLQRILGNRGFKVLRLDGTILQIAERERLISLFQSDTSYSVFLLTTQVGGVGITLTAANRVVIYDPSWNPATDSQAVDRAYRIGQKKDVVIYRLITCGTVEEKIYRRQVFKDSLIRQNTGDNKNPFRYFSRQDLRQLFILEDTRSSSTQRQLQELHSRHRRSDPVLDEHIAHLHTMDMFGISDHDLMFSHHINHDEAPENQEEHQYIEGRVQKAQDLVRAESELQMQLAESMALSSEPAWLRGPLDSISRDTTRDKKPRNPKPSPPLPQPDNNHVSPVVVDLDQSGSGEMDVQQDHSVEVIDLTAAASFQHDPFHVGPNRSSSPSEMELNHPSLLQDGGVSVLQLSDSSIPAVASRVSTELESSGGHFNLQLEDSDDVLDHAEIEEEEQKLLSQLQVIGSFDVNKSLSESLHRRATSSCQALGDESINESVNEFILPKKKKRAAVIYDSEEEEEDEEEEKLLKSPLNRSFPVLGASTPKSDPSGSSPPPRRSVGGNLSVVSRRSLLRSVIEDLDLDDQDDHEDNEDLLSSNDFLSEEMTRDDLNSEEEDEGEEDGEDKNLEKVEATLELQEKEFEGENEGHGEDGADSAHFDLHVEEESKEQEEEQEELSANVESGEDMRLEKRSSEAESVFWEGTDHCSMESESYDALVRRGEECFSQEKLEEALSFFLRAIDIRPGDPEIQLKTIQLYRRLSQR
ncbi:DNA excision repair protein ERCC-6-like [Nothobranchius furzeri]|uniref:DNA excision repair protein ERCC-6-like n=1 Tax=Nothobranchius furzeri TaxID=105023 RepID=A0A1A8U8F8_NOTFU|nr:excision repair cross-complementation group 6 like [Nothobranchius furzeri]